MEERRKEINGEKGRKEIYGEKGRKEKREERRKEIREERRGRKGTGSGIVRKERVGRKKLKPTKARAK